MALINLHEREMAPKEEFMVPVSRASYPAPFRSGLEYSAPARGGWTIVHIGFLLPESHEIYVCGKCCLRGVVLSAAELNDTHKFSTITVDESVALEGNGEEEIIEGVCEILNGLPRLPKAVEIFTSCIHHFLNTDLNLVFRRLQELYPEIGFIQCWMNPIMRKTKLAPDPFMRKQLYALLQNGEKDKRTVNIIGNNFAMEEESELVEMLTCAGWKVRDICTCHSFAEYRQMEKASCNIVTNPLGMAAAKDLQERLGQPYIYLPVAFDPDEIEERYRALEEFLNKVSEEETVFPERLMYRCEAEEELALAAEELDGVSVVIDYMATGRPLGLAKLLLTNGIHVAAIYIDSMSGEEKEEFLWLQEHAPELEIWATVHPQMAMQPRDRAQREKVLAIGQKAAYFSGTKHFVNIVEDGGLYGYGGLTGWLGRMREAMEVEREAEMEIQVKGWNCNV